MLINKMTELLQIKYPVIQAPMAGGVTTSNLVAAVSNSGGLGMIGAGYMSPGQIRDQIREVKQLTANSFGINLFIPTQFNATENEIRGAGKLLQPIRNQLRLQDVETKLPSYENECSTFQEQLKVLIEEKVPVCSFTFGVPSREVIKELKKQQIILLGTATTVEEAIINEKCGMDAVVLQGSEAGGHRGTFTNNDHGSLMGLMSLIPQTVDQVTIPVIAAGGIMDGRGLMAAICLGAKGVQMGTAFLTCIESGAHKLHKEAILNSKEDQTVLTRVYSGKWARGVKNKFYTDMQKYEENLPEFPVQNMLTNAIRKAASLQNNPDYMSLWAGQSASLAKHLSVEHQMKNIISEAEKMMT